MTACYCIVVLLYIATIMLHVYTVLASKIEGAGVPLWSALALTFSFLRHANNRNSIKSIVFVKGFQINTVNYVKVH